MTKLNGSSQESLSITFNEDIVETFSKYGYISQTKINSGVIY
jgi:uncharacterized protein (DUF4415 family)